MKMSQTDLEKLVQTNFHFYQDGKNANYIPALADVKADQLGISYYDLEKNELIQAGDANVFFAVESISKIIVLLLAIEDRGMDYVFQKVSVEPSSFAFNSILPMKLQNLQVPNNPFINAGAIVTTSLLNGANPEEAFNRIVDYAQKVCNDNEIYLDTEIYESEFSTGDTNRSIAYYLKTVGCLDSDVDNTLEVYFKQCSLMVTTKSLANLGALLANNGVAPWNNEKVFEPEVAYIVKSLMMTGGMYNESGAISFNIGLPTKSGVGGGLLSTVGQKGGIGIFSPPLNIYGNSIAGIKLLEELSRKFEFNIFK